LDAQRSQLTFIMPNRAPVGRGRDKSPHVTTAKNEVPFPRPRVPATLIQKA
jgi:hypothetical protein